MRNRTGHALIRYRVRPDALDDHLELLPAVFAELARTRPPDFRYESFQQPDRVSFIDIVAGHRPGMLSKLQAWEPYRSTLDARCDQPPELTQLSLVESFDSH